MILLIAVLTGLLVGLSRAIWYRQTYPVPSLQAVWLAVVAFLPQLVLAYLPTTHASFSDGLASAGLFISLILFSVFAWLNRRLPGMPILIVGLALNVLVIAANGGWMPISPDTASLLIGRNVLQFMNVGSRFGEKDVLLAVQNIHLEFLADRFVLPAWSPYKAAFSLGDVLVGVGVFWLLAKPAGGPAPLQATKGVVI